MVYKGMIVATVTPVTGDKARQAKAGEAMEIQTRRHILEIWRATVEQCYQKGQWRWGGRSGPNSISDAETVADHPVSATTIDSLNVDSVDETADDVLDHLRALGNAMDIPRQLIRFIAEYMRTYLIDGTPDFSGDTYFDPEESGVAVKDEQKQLHVVDSYSMSRHAVHWPRWASCRSTGRACGTRGRSKRLTT